MFVPLKAILMPACLNKLVTFLIFGDKKVKVAHFSFLIYFVSSRGLMLVCSSDYRYISATSPDMGEPMATPLVGR